MTEELRIPLWDWCYKRTLHHMNGNHNDDSEDNVVEVYNYVHTYLHALQAASLLENIKWVCNKDIVNHLSTLPIYAIGCACKTKYEYLVYDDTKAHKRKDNGKWANGNMPNREYLIGGLSERHNKPLWIRYDYYRDLPIWKKNVSYKPYKFYALNGEIYARGLTFSELCEIFELNEKGELK